MLTKYKHCINMMVIKYLAYLPKGKDAKL